MKPQNFTAEQGPTEFLVFQNLKQPIHLTAGEMKLFKFLFFWETQKGNYNIVQNLGCGMDWPLIYSMNMNKLFKFYEPCSLQQ